jgi:hypothetical protein
LGLGLLLLVLALGLGKQLSLNLLRLDGLGLNTHHLELQKLPLKGLVLKLILWQCILREKSGAEGGAVGIQS